MKHFYLLILSILTLICPSYAQIVEQAGFESFSDEHEFTKSSWETEGISVRWVNGFDQGRAFVDNAHSRTGANSLRLFYPEGEYGPGGSGVQAPIVLPPQDEYYVSYWLRFSEDFSWGGSSEGGKLPGLASGDNCSGCKTCDGTNGFSARLMWRPGGRAVLYLYHMDKTNTCGDNFDLKDKDGNAIYFEKGEWYNIVERVKVNSGNNNDGEVELWVNGQQALLVTGKRFVNNGDKVDNLYFSSFHGGGDSNWAPLNDSYIWFDDIVISTNKDDVLMTDCESDPDCIPTGSISGKKNSFSVYPNPFNNQIKVVRDQGDFEVKVFTPSGELIGEVQSTSGQVVLGERLEAGVYFLEVKGGDEVQFIRVVKGL